MDTKLITRIAECCEVEKAKTDLNHPCNKIVKSQGDGDFRLPEPWNGNIDTAESLFISSNPSIDEKEPYPIYKRNDMNLVDFFVNRFENTSKDKYSRYWKAIFKWSGWLLLGKQANEKLTDEEIFAVQAKIAMTEVVHCKSRLQIGVTVECRKKCMEKWLKEVLNRFNGKYVIVVGSIARNGLENYDFGDKKVAFVPAPNARKVYDIDRFEKISQLIK